jgi:hypothetical protein
VRIEGYTTVKEISKKWRLALRIIRIMCKEGKIEGVTKFRNAWDIPTDAVNSTDNRMTSGEYINWRKHKKDEQ